MIDLKAFFPLSYGLYLVSARDGDTVAGCTVNTLAQVTAVPARMTVAVHKDNFTTSVIRKSGFFTGVALAQTASMELIGAFGFRSSRDGNKFEGYETRTDENGVPYVAEQTVSRLSCKVISELDLGTHVLFLGEVTGAECLAASEPMTYAYYHKVKNGVTPPKASSYQPPVPKAKGFRCTVCGYILEADSLPDDLICPICHQGAEKFVPIE